jgi:hypothetical protein
MMFNATLNNISVVSWQSVLLVEEARENHQPVASHWDGKNIDDQITYRVNIYYIASEAKPEMQATMRRAFCAKHINSSMFIEYFVQATSLMSI